MIALAGFYFLDRANQDKDWLEEAVKARNALLCDKIDIGTDHGDYQTSKEEARYFCKARYGGRIGDINYCNSLDNFVKFQGTMTQKQACIAELSKKY